MIGDAFRAKGWQIVSHSLEIVQITVWIAIWGLFEFRPIYIVMYIIGRIWLFDPLYNLTSECKLTYSGKSSLYGRILIWFSEKMKEPGHLIWVIRGLAFFTWIGLIIKETI
jgi:hypothetical protein